VDLAGALLQESAVPPAKRNFSGLYVDARHAHRLKLDNPDRVVLIDVRSRMEVGLVGQPENVDIHVPWLDTATPLRWDDAIDGWAMSANPSFAAEVRRRLDRLGVPADAPLLLLCRSGERSARAADALAALGYAQTISVVDGFEGDVGAEGRRTINGWKNAGLPWTARPVATLVYGAR
jgi:rhodanese-related sulfurtransferase